MKRIVIAILLLAASSVLGANPAPRTKQLKLGTIFYGGSAMSSNTTRRQWIADRYSLVVGQSWSTSYSTVVSDLKSYNPYLRVNSYVVYAPFALDTVAYSEDTTAVRTWAGGDARMDSMVLRMGVSAGDTTALLIDGDHATVYRRNNPGQLMTFAWFAPYGIRFAWDYRYPRLGNFWAHWWVGSHSPLNGADGLFVDEESFLKRTDMNINGQYSPHYPFRDTLNYEPPNGGLQWNWLYTAQDFRKLKNPWSSSMSGTAIADSLSTLRIRTARVAAESLQVLGMNAMMNPAGYIGLRDGNNTWGAASQNWTSEGNAVSSAYRSVMLNEYYFLYMGGAGASDDGYRNRANNVAHLYYTLRDSSFESFDWGPVVYSGDTVGLGGWGRLHTLTLGHYLNCMFPGYRSSKTYFGVVNRNSVNAIYNVSIDPADTNEIYNGAFEKYFGVTKLSRDSSLSGTDGAGQNYKIKQIILGRPDDTSKTLTYVALRYANGTNKSTTTNVPVTLPPVPAGAPHNWKELLSGGTWAAAVAGGSTFNLRNIEARIFSCDTALSDSGVPLTPNARYVAVDSMKHDFSGNLDSLRFRIKTNNVSANADSVVVAWSYTGLESVDSVSATQSMRAAYTANSIITLTDSATVNETDQIYAKAWVWDNVLGWSEPVDASRTFTSTAGGGGTTPAVGSLIIDSLNNDFSSENDSIQTRTTASLSAADSLIIDWDAGGFGSLDSSLTAIDNPSQIRRASSPSILYTDKFTNSGTESYTIYVAAWHWSATLGWGARTQTSRTFTPAASAPLSVGVKISGQNVIIDQNVKVGP